MARARKENCFQRAGSANWYFYLYDDSGKRRTVCTGTADRKEAEQIRAVKQDEQRRAAVFGPQEILTFGAACGYYLKAGKNDRFLTPLFNLWEKTLVKTITAGVIKQTAIDLYPEAKPATWIRQVVTPALAVINHCAELGKCAPLRVKRWKVARVMKEAVDRDYIDAMIAAAPVPHLAALVLFMYTTGTRIGIATELTWDENVNLQAATATFGRDKNGEPHQVHLIPELVVMLANLPRTGNTARKVFGYASRHSVYGVLKKMAQDAGYRYVPPHQVGRHSFATELLDRGYSVPDVMKWGNWKSAKMVMEIYGHSKKGRAAAIEDVFSTKTPIGTISAQEPVKALKSNGS